MNRKKGYQGGRNFSKREHKVNDHQLSRKEKDVFRRETDSLRVRGGVRACLIQVL